MPSPQIAVTVLFFASLREATGTEECPLELPEGSRVSDLWPHLIERFPQLSGWESSLAWAVNHAYAKPNHPLQAGDVVAVLPPISGGSF